MLEVYQLFETDMYGTHSSRTNLGVFSLPSDALMSLVGETDRLKSVFTNETRLFVEKCVIDKSEGYNQIFDSANEDDMNTLKKIVFFESIEAFRNDLSFLVIDTDDIDFDINLIETYNDVSIDLIKQYMNIENVENFIENNLVE